MGKNKLYKFAKLETYRHVFQASFDEPNREDFHMKGKWKQAFFGNDHPLVLELGCGKGEYTVGLGELYPEKNFIGMDIKGARIYTGATQALQKEMNNVAFIRAKIELITSFFAEGEVDEIWITFPDPQMKKTRKRLTSTRFLNLYREILKPNGTLHLKTDSNFLYTYTNAVVTENDLPAQINTADLYHSDVVDKVLSIKTYYESQFYEQGIPIKYIKFSIPQKMKLVEPEIDIEFDEYRSYNRGAKMPEETKVQKK
ncbi:tRNA (guanosine(46)-N7)-methyltransferase TrmB [Saccharicrinis fermentans]|uniref:tRNA (guanine-N(7)-)-methyltransferase n=1 Tax=Saccharicrinis fermentans DSM 9555 = JCM 21142 TaxID=869213 RepID=W7Y429_9BACT|nr:tRNA (guanosine(46)-N7)-methyltransferase TrmB [Saccharicrinis fermentans]GAF02817.1 tRNA (guanine-N(7)-)-methyltransferase [Saccharicrinis fermentans DSM 9555 = JCM 21142]